MNVTIYPGLLSGSISAIPSKSQAHRLLICSAFADLPTELICPQTNRDIEATAALCAIDCLIADLENYDEETILKNIEKRINTRNKE